jgi:hypothetical protein
MRWLSEWIALHYTGMGKKAEDVLPGECMYVCVCGWVVMCACVYVCVHVCVCVSACVRASVYECVVACVIACARVCIHVCVAIQVFLCA